uniref:BIN2 n=1 Tax=Macrostomum lignano TaxID=282301 RepID=A0A1I8JRD1_9PLAT
APPLKEPAAQAAMAAARAAPSARSRFSLRAQKKIVSKLATKKSVKIFIDAASARVFDKIYKLFCTSTTMFNDEERAMADDFRDKFNDLTTDLVRMQTRRSTLDQASLAKKSQAGVRTCATFFTEPAFLSALFDRSSPLAAQMDSICDDIQDLLDRGVHLATLQAQKL